MTGEKSSATMLSPKALQTLAIGVCRNNDVTDLADVDFAEMVHFGRGAFEGDRRGI